MKKKEHQGQQHLLGQ